MDTIDKFVKQQLENNLKVCLKTINNYFIEIDNNPNKLSIKTLYIYFLDLLSFNDELNNINVELLQDYKTHIDFFSRYFQKYVSIYSNHVAKIIKDKEKENKSLEEMSKEELINLIRSK